MRKLKIIAIIYALLLLASGIARYRAIEPPIPGDKELIELKEINNDKTSGKSIRFAYKEYAAANPSDNIPVILLHGSPGDSEVFDKMAPLLNEKHRILVPDLPGFGHSSMKIPDYSFRAHAFYLKEFLEKLNIEKAHIAGFSMGGGVELSLYEIAPEKLASLTMISAIGVQEYELLGDYSLNHGIHGLQLGLFWILENLTPHFGLFDGSGISYCRNFYDSDQRPMREILKKTDVPFLIIHGKDDPLVPVEAAREHFRIVPQSEYHELEDGHFFTFMNPERAAPLMLDFFERVKNGEAYTRSKADIQRIRKSEEPFSPASSQAKGPAAFIFFLLLSLATLISEDLTCITAGVLAGQGRISLFLAIVSCIFGIYLGDILLFLSGRWLGRKALKIAPFKWFIKESAVEKASIWFQKKGAWAIFLSRFIPGLRLPTYFVAGIAKTSFWLFAFYFLIAVCLWTPVFVYLSYLLGAEAVKNSFMNSWWQILILIIAIYIAARIIFQLFSWRGRRLLLGKFGRWRHWEFWPMQLFYPPVLAYVAWLAIRFRGLNTFTCANPAIYAGGFIGESKDAIYEGISKSEEAAPYLLKYLFIKAEDKEKLESANRFMSENSLGFPIALKPDTGERGADVFIIKNQKELAKRLSGINCNSILQEFAGGQEFGVFYYRYPREDKGKIFAITEKQFPSVMGDGETNIEGLILRDKRAICMAEAYFERNRDNLDFIPKKGEHYRLIDIGTHSRGAIFLDGIAIKTAELEDKIDRILRGYEGFYFGRFDIRTPSTEDFKLGTNFKVIELNGVTSEATSIYDRKNGVFDAYRILFRQWRIAFEIGAENRARGIKPVKIIELIKLLLKME